MRKSTLISFGLVGFLATALLAFAQDAGPQPSQINIDVRDYCDPTSFNAVLGSVGAWRFVPNQIRAHEGATLNLQNLGGETHTFTRVKRFGGGFVSVLNFLPPAPECAQMVNGNLVPTAAKPRQPLHPRRNHRQHHASHRRGCPIPVLHSSLDASNRNSQGRAAHRAALNGRITPMGGCRRPPIFGRTLRFEGADRGAPETYTDGCVPACLPPHDASAMIPHR